MASTDCRMYQAAEATAVHRTVGAMVLRCAESPTSYRHSTPDRWIRGKAWFPSWTGVHDTIRIAQALRDAHHGEITNKARRQGSADRIAAARALLTAGSGIELADHLAVAVLDHAPREILPAAAHLLGLDVPARPTWEASGPAEVVLRAHAATGADAQLRVAVAIHWALAEKDAGAEHPAYRGGAGVIAYTDLLVANGYTETAGDAANRDRYRGGDAVGALDGVDDDEPVSDDEDAVE